MDRGWLPQRVPPSLVTECSRLTPISRLSTPQGHARSQVPSLHEHYLASTVLRTCPTPQAARPVPHGLPVGSEDPPPGVSRVCVTSPMQTCCRHYPGGTVDGIGLLPWHRRQRPSPCVRRVGSRIKLFEACSAFTHVTACLLAEPLKRPFPSKAPAISLPPPPLRLLPAGATLAGRELHPLRTDTYHGARAQ